MDEIQVFKISNSLAFVIDNGVKKVITDSDTISKGTNEIIRQYNERKVGKNNGQ